MSKTLILAGWIAASILPLACLGAEFPTASEERLAIVLGFREPYSPAVPEEMKRELESILHIRGLNIEWRDLKDSPEREVFDHVVVARFAGKCQMAGSHESDAAERTLGFTHISDGAIIPFAEIDCQRVAAMIRRATGGETSLRMETLLGRALGRVLAHELYHILAETVHHAKSGVAKALLTPQDLVLGRLLLEDANLEAIRDKVLQPRYDQGTRTAGQ